MTTAIRAPTPLSLHIVALTDSASDEQILPPGKNVVSVISTAPYYIIFGQPGLVPDPADGAMPGPGDGTAQKYTSSSGATAFRVIADPDDSGILTWQVE